ncbi:hypothetical protein [Arenimonas alkanexedens]
MKRTVLSLLIALAAFSVHARAPAEAPAPRGALDVVAPADSLDTKAVAPVADAEAEVDTAKEAEALADKKSERNCVRETGTRIKYRDRHGCNGQFGESYTGDELRSTGATNVGDALRMLSPRIGN